MRLLVCGSRTFTDRARLRQLIDQAATQAEAGAVVLIEGGARGADRLAGELARERGWTHHTYPADWHTEGRSAGPRRNARMLRQGRPDLVLAFVTTRLQDSRGTADLVRRARAAGIEVRVFEGGEAPPTP
jgi:YspA, cpYpsA-related SLOG family